LDKIILFFKKTIHTIYRINFRFDFKQNIDFLIWDFELSEEIIKLIDAKYSYQVLARRESVDVPLSIGFIIYLFKNIIKGHILPIPYLAASYLSPKIIITYIDNSLNYKYIKLLNSSIRLISIQNGTRYDFMMQNFIGFEFDIYLGFGRVEKEIMENAGIIVNKYYPVGALSLCNKNIYKSVVDNRADIVFISDIVSADFHGKKSSKNYKVFYALYEEYTKIICSYLDIISKETGLSIVVAMRTNQFDPAHIIETSLYKPFRSLIRIPRVEESSYQHCINSKLVITIGSTLGYEMLGLYKKVLFCNGITDISTASFKPPFIKNFYTDYLQDSYLIRVLELNSFKEKILTMIERPTNLHLADIKVLKNEYMNFSEPEIYKSNFNDIVSGLIK